MSESQLTTSPTIAGWKIVVAMFSLGIVATGILWVYWNMHLMPFMPLQNALVQEFEDCHPRVDGGQRKKHKETPHILRVVMELSFDPNSEDEGVEKIISERVSRTAELAKVHTEIDKFEVLEVHMFFQPKNVTGEKRSTLMREVKLKDNSQDPS